MSLKVQHKNHVPHGGYFVYLDAETGLTLRHPYFSELLRMARKHRTANSLPYLSEDAFEDNVCKQMPAICEEPRPAIITRAWRLGAALVHWASLGFPVCTEEQAAARLAICEACQYWGGMKRFGISCGKCGCSGIKLSISSSTCPDNPPRWKALV